MTPPWPSSSQGLQVGDLLVDLRYRRVLTAEGGIELQQRVFDLLLLMMAEPNKLFTRSELFDRLWSGLVVDDANLSQSIWLLRKALGESRREWIRTVAKRGYVFQPPGPVQWFSAMPTLAADGSVLPAPAAVAAAPVAEALLASPTAVDPTSESPALADAVAIDPASAPETIVHAPPQVAQPQVPAAATRLRRRPGLRQWLAAAALVLVCAAGVLWLAVPRAPAVTAVALMSVQGHTGSDVPWASGLLQQWLGWKLGQLPTARVLSAEDLAGGQNIDHPAVVLLSATRSADGKRVTVRARIQRKAGENVLEESADISAIPALVDRMSAHILAAVMPDAPSTWPVLEIDAASAQRYAPVAEAFDRSDWQAVDQRAPEVLASAPRFGLGHLQLGLAQARLGESARAIRQLEIAGGLLRPLPDDARLSLQAMRLEVDPRRTRDAERALQALVAAHPGHAVYRQRYISLLIATGQYTKALAEIHHPAAAGADTPTERFQREVQYSDIYYALGQGRRSQRHAQAAYALAEAGGDAMRAQRADAALLDARALVTWSPQQGVAAYRRAAQLAQEAGSPNVAEHAAILAELHASQAGQGSQGLTAALERARQAGAAGLEADILVTLANVSADDTERMRWLTQALQTAQSMGNLNLQGEIEAELVIEDLLQLRLVQARARATHVQALALEGVAGIRINRALSRVQEMEGQVERARAASLLATQAVPSDADGLNSERADAACTAMRLNAYAGKSAGDPTLDTACAQADSRPARFDAAWSRALVAVMANRAGTARHQYQLALDLLQQGQATAAPDPPAVRATTAMRLAFLALRLGDGVTAGRLVAQVRALHDTVGLPPLQQAQLAVLEVEADAAAGQWSRSRQRASQVRATLPAQARELLDRLDLLQINDDQRSGRQAQAIALATALYARAGGNGDQRTQQQVASLVGLAALQLSPAAAEAAQARQARMPGATLAWLTPAEQGQAPALHGGQAVVGAQNTVPAGERAAAEKK
ncbi:winged helix-turn-helix domain-containing protein [Bacillus subtilis subsp. subtilis]|nr:winged helix-turn-helix domain-containing protein [Bacillus subtilis subsp. subtilis]